MEISTPHNEAKVIHVTDATQAGAARRRAADYAEQLAFSEPQSGALAIVVTEIVTNLVKHAKSGTLILSPLGSNGNRGIRALALDKGPGIRDVTAALSDGHSTAGTPGNGLGAIKRLSNVFEVYSAPGAGTVVLAEVWSHKKAAASDGDLDIGVVSAPIKGEEVSGDGWGAKTMPSSTLLMVVDGLGHGVMASEAAREAERIFFAAQTESPGRILQDAHGALRKTRGAAMAVASINSERGLISYAGVGNISASIVSPQSSRGIASHNGTLGHQMQKLQEFSLPWNPNSLLIMHSDGLNTRWDLKAYPGIWSKSPALIAGVLYRDCYRDRDDVTILVARQRQEAASL